jgi:hypothetical protein
MQFMSLAMAKSEISLVVEQRLTDGNAVVGAAQLDPMNRFFSNYLHPYPHSPAS